MVLTPKDFHDYVTKELSINELMIDDTELILTSTECREVPVSPEEAKPAANTPDVGGTTESSLCRPDGTLSDQVIELNC